VIASARATGDERLTEDEQLPTWAIVRRVEGELGCRCPTLDSTCASSESTIIAQALKIARSRTGVRLCDLHRRYPVNGEQPINFRSDRCVADVDDHARRGRRIGRRCPTLDFDPRLDRADPAAAGSSSTSDPTHALPTWAIMIRGEGPLNRRSASSDSA
jgi:hypothetical protein